jgi:hypothetical protein
MTPREGAAAIPAAPPPPARRMTLASIGKGRKRRPFRVMVIGVEGVGKSTFGASAPNPVFLGAEDGLPPSLANTPSFSTPETWSDVMDALRSLDADHDFQTLVIDTADWIEPLLWRDLCDKAGKASIEDFGFGKGYVAAVDGWRAFIAALERLWSVRGMNIIILAHAHVRPFRNPAGEDYDRFTSKIHDKAGGLLREWADAVLFAVFETVVTDEKGKRAKGVSSGRRVMYTTRDAAWDAKNRYSLPPEIELSWDAFIEAVNASLGSDVATLRADLTERAKALGPEMEAKVAEAVARAGDDAGKLVVLSNWLAAQTAKKEQ